MQSIGDADACKIRPGESGRDSQHFANDVKMVGLVFDVDEVLQRLVPKSLLVCVPFRGDDVRSDYDTSPRMITGRG